MPINKLAGAVAIAVATLACSAASAQDDYPNRPITLIVPYGAGGGVSINALALAPFLSEELGQEVSVVNRTGAGGVAGHTMGAMAEPDGYTLTMVSPGILSAPLLVDGVEFAPEDFAYIGQVTFVPNFLAVNADSPYQTLDDLVKAMKENPGTITAGRTNGWPSSDIAQEVFFVRAGVEPKMIPGMSGGAEKDKLVLGGQLDLVVGNLNELLPFYQAKQFRVLAAASPERDPAMPDVPTFKELGYEVETGVWRTLAAPKDTPEPVLEKLRTALKTVMEKPELAADFEKKALSVDYLGTDEARQKVLAEYEELGDMFSELGLNIQTN